jgi:predicted RNase H-like HicB family nuclease
MVQAFYPATIDKDPDSDYGVVFPDFPGCVSAGSTIDEAITMAAEALALHVTGMIEDGEALPPPTPADAIIADPDVRMICIVMVPVTMPAKIKRINITIDERLLAQIDAVSKNRSGFLADAARRALAG